MSFDGTIPARVVRVTPESPRVKRFVLEAIDPHRLPPFSPGAHITTFAEFDGTVFERNYSLCNDAAIAGSYEIAICLVDNSQGGAAGWHRHIREGSVVHISLPKNHFPLSERARHHVFLAAGIGITPFLSMMTYLRANGESFELHYVARSRMDCPFHTLIETEFANSTFYFSNEGQRLSPHVLAHAKIGTHVYLCGPQGFMETFSEGAQTYGFPKSNIHVERFTASIPENPSAFRVCLQKSRQEVEVGPDETLLAALLRSGVKVRYACRAGGCGTCEVAVSEGYIEHRDFYLTDDEKATNRSIITCVSRAVGDRLVLDL